MKRIGLMCVVLALAIARFVVLEIDIFDIVIGLLLGIGLCFLIIGLLPENACNKLKNIKNSLSRRV
jgi:hypothetical protein